MFVYLDGEHGMFGPRDVAACCVAAERHGTKLSGDSHRNHQYDLLRVALAAQNPSSSMAVKVRYAGYVK
jgi:hypothetical protein